MKIHFSKKAMGVGEVFVYIIAALTFALIMIFGYKAINQFLEKGQQVEFVQFKTELESSVKNIYSEYGSVREVRLTQAEYDANVRSRPPWFPPSGMYK